MRRLTSLFQLSFSKSTPKNSAWSNVIGSSRFPPSSGHSCSASPQSKAEHLLTSTLLQLKGRQYPLTRWFLSPVDTDSRRVLQNAGRRQFCRTPSGSSIVIYYVLVTGSLSVIPSSSQLKLH